jgi:hypothetical protein
MTTWEESSTTTSTPSGRTRTSTTTLYHQRNKIASRNSDSRGRVGIVCEGYAGEVVAMSRALGIPARLVQGRHNTLPQDRWEKLSQRLPGTWKNPDHWWAEVYVNHRWVFVDTCAANSNKWNRSSFSSRGSYSYTGLTSRNYFDPTPQYISNLYYYTEIYGE